jgi:hypothetical protein
MTTMCDCYDVSGPCASRAYTEACTAEPPKPKQLFGEAALMLAVPLALAMAASFVLPLAGLVSP